MYLRQTKQRRADGTTITHYQLAESRWNKEKKRSETRIVCNCGRIDDPEVVERLRRLAKGILRRCAPEELAAEGEGWKAIDAWPYGHLYVLEALWKRLGFADVIEKRASSRRLGFRVERALFAMVANRASDPCSKLYCWEQWLREEVRIEGSAELELHHLYRAMDFLEANKEEVEREIYFRVASLLNLDVDLVFYDTTSLHFEVDEEDTGAGQADLVRGSKLAGAKSYPAPRKRGKSKNGRGDAPQIVVGLAVTREGFPVRHWVFPGNTVDVTTVKQVKADLQGWKLGRCVFVGDAGMVSQENLESLARGGGKYIVCVPMRRGDEVTKEVLRRPGRYKEVTGNLKVKEVVVGDGERRRRYVIGFNPLELERQRKHRAQVLEELEAELSSLKQACGKEHSKRTCELRASRRYGKYLRFGRGGKLVIDRAKVKKEEKLDGKFVVHSNDDTLSSEDMALGYKQLQRVEEAWRTLKSVIRMRPVFHWAPHRIHAHIALSVQALLLERVAEHLCQDTWRNIRDDLRQIKLVQLSTPTGELWQVTEPLPAAAKRLRSLGIEKPPALVRVD